MMEYSSHHWSQKAKSTILRGRHRRGNPGFWDEFILPVGLPILLGLALAPLLALLIVNQIWFYVLPLVLVLPVTILIVRYPFAAILVWMVTMPWFPFNDTYRYLYFVVHRLLIPMSLGIVLLSRMLKLQKYKTVRLGPADLGMIAFGVLGIISVFVTGNHWKLIFTIQDRFLVPSMAYWLVRLSDSPERDLRRLMPLMLLIALAQYTIGLVSWFAPQALPSIWHTGLVGDRVIGTFRQPGAYASVLILFMVLLYHKAMSHERGLRRMFLVLVFGVGLVCIFFTFTRSAWLAGSFVLLGVLCLYPRITALLIAIVFCIMAILSAGPLANELAHASERFERTTEGAYERSIQAEAGKNMFFAKPVFGWGFGNYDRYDWKFMERTKNMIPTKYHVQKSTSHNTSLTILAEMGAVGFFLYYFPIIYWLFFSIKALPRLPKEGFWSRRLLLALWLPVCAHVIVSQSIDMRFFSYVLTLLWINLGLIANIVHISLQSSESSWSNR